MRVNFGTDFGVSKLFGTNFGVSNQYISPVLSKDTVSFSGDIQNHKVKTDYDTAEFVANSLSSSTSGHRATYGGDKFNPDIVELLTVGVGQYAKDHAMKCGARKPMVIIGGDTREATQKSLPLISETLRNQGVDVVYIKEPVPTPLLAMMTRDEEADISILLTASHNPWSDGGYNLVTKEGAIAPVEVTKEVAKNVADTAKRGSWQTNKRIKGDVIEYYPYLNYKKNIERMQLIDWDNIRNSGISIHYDGLHGTGSHVFPRLLEDNNIPFSEVVSGEKEGPNPIKENLTELMAEIERDNSPLKIGLANDGDADRFGIIDENGEFITPNDVILLTAHHLADNKGIKGNIVRSQATSSQLDLFGKKKGLETVQTPVGFKYIAEDIISEREKGKDILVAGEESGGLTLNGHIPEKDGIIALLMMVDMVATERKPISQILKETKESMGVEFRADSFNKKLENEADKKVIMDRMEGIYNRALEGDTKFGNFNIDVETTKANAEAMQSYRKGGDGVKLYFDDGSSVLVRKSGTEPKVKAYIETYNEDAQTADNNVKELRSELEKVFTLNSSNGVSFKGNTEVKVAKGGEFDCDKYKVIGQKAVEDIASRAGVQGQFLNWIGNLPLNQLENIDNIYEMADKAKADGSDTLAVLGIGGSRHTTEAMMTMLGKEKNIKFFSSVEPESFERFINNTDLDRTKFLVVSKSGTTLETTTAYNQVKEALQKHTNRENVSDKLIAMTDSDAGKSDLRKAVNSGEIGMSGLVHDDVGGRFSIFDDATLFAMAFSGVDKEDAKSMLKASVEAQGEFLNPDITKNKALQLAAFNVEAQNAGKTRHYNEYFSDAFQGTTLWDKQLNNESLKAKISTETNVGPGYLHYNAEADLDEANKDSFYTFIYPKTNDRVMNAVTKGVTTAYSKQHPVAEVILDDLTPDSIARFIELKHFETLYTGNMLRQQQGDITPKNEPLPEVIQPNVEKYKKEVKANL